jgi:AbrB family looped-hinge helix DNA binding protein
MSPVKVKVSETGRLSLPVEVRRQLGIEKGGTLLLETVDGEIHLTTLRERVRRIQARARELLADRPLSSDDLIRWRREEAAREEADYRGTFEAPSRDGDADDP